MTPRQAEIRRNTRETEIELRLGFPGSGQVEVSTGIGFLDHLFSALATHAGWDLFLRCHGDLAVDDHHTAEDCALCLGEALDRALGDRQGIRRFGFALVPMDEALAEAAVDLVTRPFAVIALGLERPQIGALASENVTHVLSSLACAGRFCLHLEVRRGANDHHRAEAAFKALALALKQALEPDGSGLQASTKGSL